MEKEFNTMSKKIITLILICLMSVTISACSKPEAIDGTWSMIRQEHADGTVYEGDDLPVHEYYVIDGDEAKYSLKETNWYLM